MFCKAAHISLCLVLVIFATATLGDHKLEPTSDEDLSKLLVTERHVIVLFTKNGCDSCDEMEELLASSREDLVDALGAWVVKAVSSPLARKYTISKDPEPSIVFFRSGVPLLYDGPLNEEVMLDVFVQNQEPAVHLLTDETFEHLTQAASGATTGDWFVLFYRNDSEPCHRFESRWEYVGSQLKGKINLAKVDIQDSGISTGRRFQIEKVPTFLFFRQGKIYHCDIDSYDSKSFVEFAKTWYKNAASRPVPVPQSPFDEVIDRIVFHLQENPLIIPVAGLAFITVLIISLAMMWKNKKSNVRKTSDKKKKSK